MGPTFVLFHNKGSNREGVVFTFPIEGVEGLDGILISATMSRKLRVEVVPLVDLEARSRAF